MDYPVLAAQDTWYRKEAAKRSTITKINIVDSYTETDYDEFWNADVDGSGAIKCYRTGTVLTIAGNGTGGIAMNTDSSWAFSHSGNKDYFASVTTIDVKTILDFSNVTSIKLMFNHCETLSTLDVYNWDVSSVTDMTAVFQHCYALNELDVSNWDVSSVTTMAGTFSNCRILTTLEVSNWDVGKVTNMNATFQNCYALTTLNVSNWDVSSVTNMKNMFKGCEVLTTLDVFNWDVGKVETMERMFEECFCLEFLDVSAWNVGSVTSMKQMFWNCSSLTSLNVSDWNVSKVTSMHYMFKGCSSLVELKGVSNWNVGSVTNMYGMFSSGENYGANCVPLTILDLSQWNVSNVTNMGWMFYGMQKLRTLNVTGWDVRKVQSFHHFAAHCADTSSELPEDERNPGVNIIGTETWKVSTECDTLNAMFHGCGNTSFDLSQWDVSGVKNFGQMFEKAHYLKQIKGLDKWDTSNGYDFSEMFSQCWSLSELDLSKFDTTNASCDIKDWDDPYREGELESDRIGGMEKMFNLMRKLKKITLGPNFSFVGNGKCTGNVGDEKGKDPAILPASDPVYITGADGNWYDIDGTTYTPADIPGGVARTYYASLDAIDITYLTRHVSLLKLAKSVRKSTGTTEKMTIDGMITALDDIDGESIYNAGKQAAYDNFWDDVQQYNPSTGKAERTNYRLAFAGGSWTSENLKPKYSVTFPEGTTNNGAEVFSRCGMGNNEYDGMVDVSFACAQFDFSNCLQPNNLFLNASVKNITVDLSGATNLNGTFSKAETGKMENIKLKVSANCTFSNTFAYRSDITALEFTEDSEIGNTITFQHCTKLTLKSAKNIINTLKNYKDTDLELINKLTFASAVWDTLEASGPAPHGGTWKDYLNTVLGWSYA